MSLQELFFPNLERREQYSLTGNGSYYADYTVYRQEIREDSLGRCVYCDGHENEVGGQENMQLDHFRPRKHFASLHNDPNNLVWSCAGCNRLKHDHWPALGTDETMIGEQGFVDRFAESQWDYFRVLDNGELESVKSPASYMIELLSLNRQLRKVIRQKRILAIKNIKILDQRIADDEERIAVCDSGRESDAELYGQLTNKLIEIRNIRDILWNCLDFQLYD